MCIRDSVDLANRNISYYKNMKIYKTALAQTDPKKSAALLEEIRAALKKDRESALAIKKQYRELWLRENNPYWLDKNMAKYDELAAKIASASGFLAKAAADAEKGLPPASEAGFDPFRK